MNDILVLLHQRATNALSVSVCAQTCQSLHCLQIQSIYLKAQIKTKTWGFAGYAGIVVYQEALLYAISTNIFCAGPNEL